MSYDIWINIAKGQHTPNPQDDLSALYNFMITPHKVVCRRHLNILIDATNALWRKYQENLTHYQDDEKESIQHTYVEITNEVAALKRKYPSNFTIVMKLICCCGVEPDHSMPIIV